MNKSSLSNFLSFNTFLLFGCTGIKDGESNWLVFSFSAAQNLVSKVGFIHFLKNRLTVILMAILLLSSACKRKDISTVPGSKEQQAKNAKGGFSDPRFYNNIGAFIKPASVGAAVCIGGMGVLILAGFLSGHRLARTMRLVKQHQLAGIGKHYLKTIQYNMSFGRV